MLRVSVIEPLCADAVAVSFAVPEDLRDTFAFAPGQSLTVRRRVGGVDERRSYSICAPAGSPPRIGVREVAGGVVSSWLVHQVRVGDEVDVLPPAGLFTADLSRPGRHVMIAAGSGITPVLSVASSVLAASASSAVTLLYGNRRSDTAMFVDELADLKDSYPDRFELVHVLSREPRAELFTGRLDAGKLRILLPALLCIPDVSQWWLCGPYEMVRGAQGVLAESGVPAGAVHRELFYVEETPPEQATHEEAPPPAGASEVTVILSGRATTMALPRDNPVLDSAQRVRPDLPFACKGGVCGTCRARVTAGEVRMRRNFALEPAEVEAGFVLTCQSLPVSDSVTVDYDT